ncbi:hypothetical protein KKH38_02755 [Patescibacteria group bacterium]|nr:hypothetical protein [Patescibacteria group bacterium]
MEKYKLDLLEEYSQERVSKSEESFEKEVKPKIRLMITRHAERIPSGELSPEGVKSSKEKGQKMQSGAEVLKGYASDEKSNRTFDTSEFISNESEIKSPLTDEAYATRKVADIQYNILKPDLTRYLVEAKNLIEEATLKEIGLSTERDEKGKLKMNIEKLSKEEQIKIAPTRQKNQKLGMRFVLEKSEVVHRLAMGLAHQLVRELNISDRYVSMRDKKEQFPKKDVVLNTVTHGLFLESLLKEAGVYKNLDGTEQKITDFEDENFGGYIQPSESVYLDIEDSKKLPKNIPVVFEKENRPKSGAIFVNLEKMKQLDDDYLEWKNSQNE